MGYIYSKNVLENVDHQKSEKVVVKVERKNSVNSKTESIKSPLKTTRILNNQTPSFTNYLEFNNSFNNKNISDININQYQGNNLGIKKDPVNESYNIDFDSHGDLPSPKFTTSSMRSKLSKQKRMPKYFNNSFNNNPKISSNKRQNFDEDIFNSNKDNLPQEERSFLNDNYLSISDNSIISDINCSYIPIKTNNIQEQKNDDTYDMANISQVLLKKSYYIFYFEIHYFMLWNPEFIRTIFPENNLLATLMINDDRENEEKIFFVKSEEKAKYVPIFKKEDIDKKCQRVILYIPEENENVYNIKPVKICLSIYVFTNGKLLPLSSDEFFIRPTPGKEMHKFQIYQNTYMKYNNKKTGNIFFNFMYKIDRLNIKDNFNKHEYNLDYYNYFSKKFKLQTYKLDNDLKLNYYKIGDIPLIKNIEYVASENNFASLKDLNILKLSEELKNDISLDRLLELFTTDCSKYEFFSMLNKLNDFLNKKEFTDTKLNLFKEKLYFISIDILSSYNDFDGIIIPYFFHIIIKTFFKVHKIPKVKEKDKLRKSNSGTHLQDKSKGTDGAQGAFSNKNIEYLKLILTDSLNLLDHKFPQEVSLSSLNFLMKNIEENYVISGEGKKKVTSEEFFVNYIITNKLYVKLCDLLIYLSKNPACAYQVTFIIFRVLKKSTKENLKEIISFIKRDGFKEVFKDMIKTHDSNGLITANISSILYLCLEHFEIDEMFQLINIQKIKDIFISFKLNGFDNIHESFILLIKGLLTKKSSIANTSINTGNTGSGEYLTANTSVSVGLEEKDYLDIVSIFSHALNVMIMRINILDFMKIVKGLFNLMTHIYTICNIINNINEKNASSAHELSIEKKIPDYIIECLNILNDKKIFSTIDNGLDKYETTSINTKMIIFRTVYHAITLIMKLNEIDNSVMVINLIFYFFRANLFVRNYIR